MRKRILSILMCLCLFTSFVPELSIRVVAADSLFYKDVDGSEKSATATRVTSSDTAIILNTGWYYVQGDVVIKDTVTVSGNVRLILTDGSSMTVIGKNFSGAMLVTSENSLTIYGQSGGTGALIANGAYHAAGIGTYTPDNYPAPDCGTITINGGFVTASGLRGAGIGGGLGGRGGTVTINGGTVKASAQQNATGIGGGMGGEGGTVTINGGMVTATGAYLAAGIGGGADKTAGSVTINGGSVTAYGGYEGAAIGGGYRSRGGSVTINGGSVKATGGYGAQAIGNGKDAQAGTGFTAKNVAGTSVYRTTVALSGVTTNEAVNALTTSAEDNYIIKDMQTDGSGKLYLYLPMDTTVTAVSSASKNYFGTVTTLSNGSANGILYTVLASGVSVPLAGTYGDEQMLDFTAHFTDSVTVNTSDGIPYISLIVGITAREATYISGSGTSALLFRYTVLPGDNDQDGISIGNSIVLNGGTIKSDDDIAGIMLSNVDSTAGILVDTPPIVTINSLVSGITNWDPIPVTITFNEIITGFDMGDLTVGNGTPDNFSGSGKTYTVAIIPSADGPVTVDIAAGVAQDVAGNGNIVAAQFSIDYDGTAPTVVISGPAANPTNLNAIPVTITFSEIITGFDMGDLTVGNGTPDNFSGSGTTYMVAITPSADGPVTVDIAAGVAQDVAGNGNIVAAQFSIDYDGTAPTVVISGPAANPTNWNAIPVTITFNEIITGFDMGNVTVGNGTPDNFSGSGTTYTVAITPFADGPVTVDIAAGMAQDAAGNANTAAAQFSVDYDGTVPTVYSIMPADGSINVLVSGNSVITFSEEMDIWSGTFTLSPSVDSTETLTGGTWSGGNTIYTVSYSSLAYDTDYALALVGFKDVASNMMSDFTHGFTTELEPLTPTVSLNSLTIGKGGIASLSIALGQGTAAATSASVVVSDSVIAEVNVSSLTANGSIIVSGLVLGTTDITVTFYDADGALDTATVSVTVEAVAPTWPQGSSLIASNLTYTGALLTWTTANDVTEVTKYRIYQDGVLLETLDSSTFTYAVTELSASTTYSFQVQAGNEDKMWTDDGPIIMVTTRTPFSGIGGSSKIEPISDSGGSSMTATIITENGVTETVPIITNGNLASVTLSSAQNNALAAGAGLTLTLPSVSDATSYGVKLPAGSLSEYKGGTLTLNTELGSIMLPSDMLSYLSGTSGQTFQVTIGRNSVSNLPKNVQEAVGERPLVQLTMSVNDTQIDWSNSNAPVTVFIPYTPTADELLYSESIVVWYIDGEGNLNCVTNAKYEPLTGMVVFRITHFSNFAVGYNPISFSDVDEGAWYFKAVNYLSAREITSGTGDGRFSPDAKLTRGEFIVMLMRACEINPDEAPTDNFSDAGSTYYTGYLAAAKRLGLADGVGNNQYAPEQDITRQEMFTLLYKTLKDLDRVMQGDASKEMVDFSDAWQIESWAIDAVSLLIEIGVVEGNAGKLSPLDQVTRAEMAQILYKLEFPM